MNLAVNCCPEFAMNLAVKTQSLQCFLLCDLHRDFHMGLEMECHMKNLVSYHLPSLIL